MAQYVKQIDDYLIKDEEARASIETINASISTLVSKSNEQTNKLNEHTDTLESLATSNNTNASNISLLQTKATNHENRIAVLEDLTHLRLVYDATNEAITFENIGG